MGPNVQQPHTIYGICTLVPLLRRKLYAFSWKFQKKKKKKRKKIELSLPIIKKNDFVIIKMNLCLDEKEKAYSLAEGEIQALKRKQILLEEELER